MIHFHAHPGDQPTAQNEKEKASLLHALFLTEKEEESTTYNRFTELPGPTTLNVHFNEIT